MSQDSEQTSSADLPELTPKQFAFVQGILAGKTATDAYKAAYDCGNMLDATIWRNAAALKADNKVSTWLKAARKQSIVEATYGLKEHIQDLLEAQELCRKAESWSPYMKATELLGRASGVYVERIQTEDSPQDVAKILEKMGQPGRELARQMGYELPNSDTTVPEGVVTH